MPTSLEQSYPRITRWVKTHGWIEMGQDDYSRSFVRALNGGGMVWEGQERYATLDDAMRALEAGLSEWMAEQRGE
jgi:hypothetical protein